MKFKPRQASIFEALIPIIILITFLFVNISIWGGDSVSGPNQLALIFATAIATIISIRLGTPYKKVRRFMIKNIGDSMQSILILLMIGALSGTWMLSGVVPTLIYYGLDFLSPTYFLVAALMVGSVVSLATGSSWSTIATIGVALLGIGLSMGFNPGLVAGAIISGAYFGDKLSPLSDTTNLAPAMAGTDVFTHVRYMLYTTTPTYIITVIIFFVLGFTHGKTVDAHGVSEMQLAISQTFNINPWLLLIPVFLIIIIVKKTAPIPALFIGALLGAIGAILFQPELITKIDGGKHGFFEASYRVVIQGLSGETIIDAGNQKVSELISTTGMKGMLDTIWLIITAMAFSGAMESAGLLMRLAEAIVRKARSTGSLVLATVASSIFMNITASEQYISIVVPGRMYAKIFRRKGYKPELLSRSLEDGGTVTSVLVPWNTCGAVNSSVLHIPTLTYLPFAFFNLISPLMSVLVAYINFKIRRFSPEEMVLIKKEDEEVED